MRARIRTDLDRQVDKQIEEMAKVIDEFTDPLSVRDIHKVEFSEQFAEHLYNADYRKQSVGEWGSKHHMSRSQRGRYISYNTYTCNVCGKANGRRKTPFCPYCGARMKGGAE